MLTLNGTASTLNRSSRGRREPGVPLDRMVFAQLHTTLVTRLHVDNARQKAPDFRNRGKE